MSSDGYDRLLELVAENPGLEAEETGDEGWLHLTTHDLRRTWATALDDADVNPLLALDWGGWEDLETFLDHYRGTNSPATQRRARDKVEWLSFLVVSSLTLLENIIDSGFRQSPEN